MSAAQWDDANFACCTYTEEQTLEHRRVWLHEQVVQLFLFWAQLQDPDFGGAAPDWLDEADKSLQQQQQHAATETRTQKLERVFRTLVQRRRVCVAVVRRRQQHPATQSCFNTVGRGRDTCLRHGYTTTAATPHTPLAPGQLLLLPYQELLVVVPDGTGSQKHTTVFDGPSAQQQQQHCYTLCLVAHWDECQRHHAKRLTLVGQLDSRQWQRSLRLHSRHSDQNALALRLHSRDLPAVDYDVSTLFRRVCTAAATAAAESDPTATDDDKDDLVAVSVFLFPDTLQQRQHQWDLVQKVHPAALSWLCHRRWKQLNAATDVILRPDALAQVSWFFVQVLVCGQATVHERRLWLELEQRWFRATLDRPQYASGAARYQLLRHYDAANDDDIVPATATTTTTTEDSNSSEDMFQDWLRNGPEAELCALHTQRCEQALGYAEDQCRHSVPETKRVYWKNAKQWLVATLHALYEEQQ